MRCSVLPPQSNFIRKATVCLLSFIPICAESEAVGMVINMTQKTGALIFDETADRYDIRFDLNDYYGGLHCGDCLEVFVRGKWKPTRMEYGDNWYLVGVRASDLNGLRVRI